MTQRAAFLKVFRDFARSVPSHHAYHIYSGEAFLRYGKLHAL